METYLIFSFFSSSENEQEATGQDLLHQMAPYVTLHAEEGRHIRRTVVEGVKQGIEVYQARQRTQDDEG
jgi:hypothetical protein